MPIAKLGEIHGAEFYLFSIVAPYIIPELFFKRNKIILALNYHDSLLPKYAGLNSTSWAIINDEKIHGITLHYITPKIDAGDIILQTAIPIEEDETAISLNLKCSQKLLVLFQEVIHSINTGTISPIKQDSVYRTYYGLQHIPENYALVNGVQNFAILDRLIRGLTFGEGYSNGVASVKYFLNDRFYILTAPNQKLLTAEKLEKNAEETLFHTVLDIYGHKTNLLITADDLSQPYRLSEDDLLYLSRVKALEPTQKQYISGCLDSLDASFSILDSAINDDTLEPYIEQISIPHSMGSETVLAIVYLALTRFFSEDFIFSVYDFNETIPDTLKNLVEKRCFIKASLSMLAQSFSELKETLGILKEKACLLTKDFGYRYNLSLLTDIAVTLNRTNYFIDRHKIHINIENKALTIQGLNEYQLQIRSMVHCLEALFCKYVENNFLGENLKTIRLLSDAEYQKIVYDWNNTNKPYSSAKTIHQLFEERAEKRPDDIALVFKDTALTYQELNQRANQLAHYLYKRYQVSPDGLIALYLDRNENIVIAILAILKSGGAYVPIDTNYPDKRIQHILEETHAKVLLTNQEYKHKFSAVQEVVLIDDIETKAQLAYQSVANLNTEVSQHNLAYVIYTSGTTGKPKGVMVEHGSVNNLIFEMIDNHGLKENTPVAFYSNLAFDASVYELFPALTSGCKIFLLSDTLRKDIELLSTYYRDNQIKVSFIPTALLNEFIRTYIGNFLETIYTGGEYLILDKEIDIENLTYKIINEYGITETTVCVTQSKINRNNFAGLIGKPIGNTQCYVLDANQQVLPLGAAGELYVGGVSLARGYLNNPVLTKEKFISNPFQTDVEKQKEINCRLYKTGDLVRLLPDGNIAYVGRNDAQVKISGHRVELGEIEKVLSSFPGIKKSLILTCQNKGSEESSTTNTYLVGYYSVDIKISQEDERKYIDHWRDLYNSTYTTLNIHNHKENISGWNSSYTGKEIAREDMLEWRDDTLKKIRKLNPATVLEIGSGSGLLLFNLIDEVKYYYGTDFSSLSIESLKKIIHHYGYQEKVKLFLSEAEELTYDKLKFHPDTVLINSVIQYFPTIRYLEDLLDNLINHIVEDGCIFIGDVRDYRLLKCFHYSVLKYKNDKTTCAEINHFIYKEKELLVAPEYFIQLEKRYPGILRVELSPKSGKAPHEMNLYRYDVILHINKTETYHYKSVKNSDFIKIINIQYYIEQQNEACFYIKYPNKRIIRDYIECSALYEEFCDCDFEHIENLLSIPEIIALLQQCGYTATVYLDINPAYLNIAAYKSKDCKETILVEYNKVLMSKENFSNNPSANFKLSENTEIDNIRRYLSASLPNYMVPKQLIPLLELPLNLNGKIDKNKLPKESIATSDFIKPRNELEKNVLKILSDVLNLPPNYIGIKDGFFELGGNSILMVKFKNRLSKLDAFKNIKISDLFKHTTVEQLVKLTDGFNSYEPLSIWKNRGELDTDIAIISLSGAFSGGANIDHYWDSIRTDIQSVTKYTIEDCQKLGVIPELCQDPNFVPVSGHIPDIDKFDAEFWRITPSEAEKMDPQFRKMLEHCWFLLEESGYLVLRDKLNIGVFIGGNRAKYLNNTQVSHTDQNIIEDANLNVNITLATRISYLLGLTGPSYNINTACSTSLVAVVEACKTLSLGHCDMAIAGGVTLLLPDEVGHIYQEGMIFSKNGECRPFDKDANGIIIGSGVGGVLLKRLKDAEKDGDNIIAVIRGYTSNNDGNRKVGYTAPSLIGQKECILRAQQMARITSDAISYIECHGTATKLGDPIEIQALAEAFKFNSRNDDSRNKWIIGSVKANIGHTYIAAGIAGLIKVCKMLENNLMPKQINYDHPNPDLYLEHTNFEVLTKEKSWRKDPHIPRMAAVSSFGIGGTNAHVILGDHIPSSKKHKGYSSLNERVNKYILPLSAKSKSSLEAYKIDFAYYMQSTTDSIEEIAYTLQLKRERFEYRSVIICNDIKDIIPKLTIGDSGVPIHLCSIQNTQNIAFMFPGQGNQYANMSANLYSHDMDYKNIVDGCIDIINKNIGIDFRKVLFPSLFSDNLVCDMNQTQYAQIALYTVEYSLAKLLDRLNVKAVSFIGHSIGEWVAATLAGVFSLEDAIKLVINRSKLMQNMAPGSMLAIEADLMTVENLIKNTLCEIAVINSHKNHVISGNIEQIHQLRNECLKKEIPAILLKVSHAYHSYLMEDAANKFVTLFKGIHLNKPDKKFISNITGKYISDAEATNPEYWASHIRKTVRFSSGIETLLDSYQNLCFIEVGPGHSLKSAIKQGKDYLSHKVNIIQILDSSIENKIQPDVFSKEDILGKLWVQGYLVGFNKYYHYDSQEIKMVKLPRYHFDMKSYWTKPYRNNPKEASVNLVSQFYNRVWERVGVISTSHKVCENRTILVFYSEDNGDDIEGLTLQLEKRNYNVLLVQIDGQQFSIEENKIIFNVEIEEHLSRLFKFFRNTAYSPGNIFYFDSPCNSNLDISYNCALYRLFSTLLSLITKPCILISISYQNYEVLGNEKLHSSPSALFGMMKVLPLHNAQLKIKQYDILKQKGTLEKYIDEFLNENDCNKLYAIRNQYKWTPLYKQYVPLASIQNTNNFYGKTFMITGGMGGVGVTFASYLGATIQESTIILLGRRDDTDIDANILKQLQQNASRTNSNIVYLSCDISIEKNCKNLLSKLAALNVSKIDFVLHAAGVAAKNLLEEKSFQDIKDVIAPKINGTLNIIAVARKIKIGVLINFSSIASIIPFFGNMEYALANLFLDEISYRKFEGIQKIITINLNEIKDIGMAANFIQKYKLSTENFLGMNSINSAELPAILNSILQFGINHVILSKKDIEYEIRNAYGANNKLKIEDLNGDSVKSELPSESIQEKIKAIFCSILGINGCNVADSFFELGGTSLSAIKLIAQLRQIGINLSISDVMRLNSIDKIYQHGFNEIKT